MDSNKLTITIRGQPLVLTFQPLPTPAQCQTLCDFVANSTRSKEEITAELMRMANLWNVSLEISDTSAG
jgi:hypothetical protein